MKISEMTSKTSIEVQDTDLLVIEDADGTKSITAAELRDFMTTHGAVKACKLLINETLDKISQALSDAKYIVSQPKQYRVHAWIEAATGDIQLAFHDSTKWISGQDIIDLLLVDETGVAQKNFDIQMLVAGAYEVAANYSVLDYNTEYGIVIEDSNTDNGIATIDDTSGDVTAPDGTITPDDSTTTTPGDGTVTNPDDSSSTTSPDGTGSDNTTTPGGDDSGDSTTNPDGNNPDDNTTSPDSGNNSGSDDNTPDTPSDDVDTPEEELTGIQAELSKDKAGFIKAHFDNLTQNEIAGVTFEDIVITLPETPEYVYEFVVDETSFINEVPYVATI